MPKINIENFDLYKNGNKRRLFYSIGKNFNTSRSKKVFLCHDAHNMFEDKYSSFGMAWHFNDAMEKLGIDDYLIFGLECLPGTKRLLEYSPVSLSDSVRKSFKIDNEEFGKDYIKALFNELIPFMEKKVGFNFEEANKTMLGSSMGGVITTYTALEYPKKFDNYLAFSNAFHANDPEIFKFINTKKEIGRYYHDMGGQEISDSISDKSQYINTFDTVNSFLRSINATYMSVYDSCAKHNEKAWNKRLITALTWIFK